MEKRDRSKQRKKKDDDKIILLKLISRVCMVQFIA